jgi:hypothetical protein
MKTALIALVLSARVLSAQSSVAGQWKAEFDTQVGKQAYLITLKQDGATLSGTANAELAGAKREVVFKDVKLTGDTLTFIEMLDFQGNSVPITYRGVLAGDQINFVRKVGDFGTEELVAKRQKPAGT